MALRRVFYRWLWLAVLVLPVWLLIGWGVFGENGFAILWIVFIAMPSVFLGQGLLTLITRSRPSVARTRAVSWWDVLGFGVWHILTVAVVVVDARWFAATLSAAIVAGFALFWLQFWQLRREAGVMRFRTMQRDDDGPDDDGDVLIVTESDPDR
ncbi:MFS transporter permease [Microbacterium halotolerans]|uniref:MFS transporter permease n=1 Tax=Microbacterium halotolerans TaxID=246613 RepID=UPI000E6AB22F|nr:MFS transporter permease [Microbacterium halotolerans]